MIINVIPAQHTPSEPYPHLTRHAWERMTSLGFTTQDIVDTITEPLWTRPNGPEHPQDFRVHVGHDLLVVWNPRTSVVLTVLLRTEEPYEHGTHNRHHLPTAA